MSGILIPMALMVKSRRAEAAVKVREGSDVTANPLCPGPVLFSVRGNAKSKLSPSTRMVITPKDLPTRLGFAWRIRMLNRRSMSNPYTSRS